MSDKNSVEHLSVPSPGEFESSIINRVPSTSDKITEEDQENIRPEKIKAKNKLNLKLNLNKKTDDKTESSATNGFSATLNLPSPAKCIGSVDKTLSKGKRDNKMRVRVSNKKEKSSVDKHNKKNSKNGSIESLVNHSVGKDSGNDSGLIKSEVQSLSDHQSHKGKCGIDTIKEASVSDVLNADSTCTDILLDTENDVNATCDVNSDTSGTISTASGVNDGIRISTLITKYWVIIIDGLIILQYTFKFKF